MDGLTFQTHTVYRDQQSGSLLLLVHHNPMALCSLALTQDGNGKFDAAHPSRADVDTINYTSLCDKMSEAAIKVCVKNLPAYLEGKLPGVEQDESLVTIANKIKPEDEKLDLSKPTKDVINYIRGLSDEPGAYIYVDGKKLKIFKAHQVSSSKGEVGKLEVSKVVTLQLSDGAIQLDILQMEGKKRMDGKSFANGNKALDGAIAK